MRWGEGEGGKKPAARASGHRGPGPLGSGKFWADQAASNQDQNHPGRPAIAAAEHYKAPEPRVDCLCCFVSLCISAPASHSQGQWRPRSRLTRGREMRYIKERLLLFCFFIFGRGTQSNSLHSKCVYGAKVTRSFFVEKGRGPTLLHRVLWLSARAPGVCLHHLVAETSPGGCGVADEPGTSLLPTKDTGSPFWAPATSTARR